MTQTLLQTLQVAFLWLQDWLPLGGLNNITAIRGQNTRRNLVITTLVQSLPFTIGLVGSLAHLHTSFSHWLWDWLWISYGLLFAGELRAWWIPYFLRPEPARAGRYQAMFGATHVFLPRRNGIVPNTLHTLLHAATLARWLCWWRASNTSRAKMQNIRHIQDFRA